MKFKRSAPMIVYMAGFMLAVVAVFAGSTRLLAFSACCLFYAVGDFHDEVVEFYNEVFPKSKPSK